MHNALRMTVVQCLMTSTSSIVRIILPRALSYLNQLIHIVSDILIGQRRIEHFEIRIVHVFENQTGRFGLWIADDIQQSDNVRSAHQCLQNLDLSLYLTWQCTSFAYACLKPNRIACFFLLDRFEDLDDAFCIADDVDALKNFAVLSSAHFPHDLIIILSRTARNSPVMTLSLMLDYPRDLQSIWKAS